MPTFKFTPVMILAAAGSYAVPASAAVITQTYNLPLGKYGVKTVSDITIGGNLTPQYSITDDFSVKILFETRDVTAYGNSLFGPLIDTPTIPTNSAGFNNTHVTIGFPSIDNRYLQLKFDIDGKSTFGVASFGTDLTLQSISYNSTAFGSGVPEPAVWLELIAGLGGTGAVMRSRRRRSRQPVAMAA